MIIKIPQKSINIKSIKQQNSKNKQKKIKIFTLLKLKPLTQNLAPKKTVKN